METTLTGYHLKIISVKFASNWPCGLDVLFKEIVDDAQRTRGITIAHHSGKLKTICKLSDVMEHLPPLC